MFQGVFGWFYLLTSDVGKRKHEIVPDDVTYAQLRDRPMNDQHRPIEPLYRTLPDRRAVSDKSKLAKPASLAA